MCLKIQNDNSKSVQSISITAQGWIVNKSSNIIKYSPEDRDHWRDVCGVFNKIDVQWWNVSHLHYCYITMQSICCHGDTSQITKSWSVRLVIDPTYPESLWELHCTCLMCILAMWQHNKWYVQNLREGGGSFICRRKSNMTWDYLN